jgi:ligand-binding sensor domain-containing protein/signal transduction histidine kinase
MKCFTYRSAVLVGCLILAIQPYPASALNPARSIGQYACRSWTCGVGLPANGINAITQTKDGFLWLGTQKGLVRFDGVEFSVIRLPDHPLFRIQTVSSLCQSRDGGFWFGVQNGAFGHYNLDTGFTTLPDDPWLNPGMHVATVYEAGDGSVWVGADGPAVRFVGGQTNLTMPFTNEIGCRSIYEDSHKRVWLGIANKKLCCWAAGRLAAFPDPSMTNDLVFTMTEDALGQIWLGTERGLRCYDAALRRVKIPSMNNTITALLTDRQGVLWIGTVGAGLWRWQDGRFSTLQMTDGLADNHVNCLFEDREGSLWVGTRNGLTQVYDVRFPLYAKSDGLPEGSYHGVCASAKGGLWAATSAGLSYFNGREALNYSQEAGLRSTWLKIPFEARNGDVYLIDADRQVEVFAGGAIVARHGYQNAWPAALAEDRQGVLVSVANTLLRASRDGLEPYPFPLGQAPPFMWIRHLWVCRDGAILVADVNGVFRIKNGRWERWGIENGLPVNEALWVCEDDEGIIWAGLTGGLVRIKGHQVNAFAREQGLLDTYISAIVPDQHGWLWMQSDQGLFRVSKSSLADVADHRGQRLQCLAYEDLESVKTTDTTYVEHSACRTADGRIWFPSPQGLIMVDPELVPTNSSIPLVHILRVRINGRDESWQRPLVVPSGRGELEVEFTAATFIAPRKVQFRYRLEGYSENTIDAGTRRSAFFTNLKPGAYHFQVQACNPDGIWIAGTDGFALELLPHYYQTVWFKSLGVALFACLLLGLYLWRFDHLRRKQRRLQEVNDLLEIKVEHRTVELANSNAALKDEIEERKRMELEVERIHKQLMDASRQAGQAEVASNVLHNVGNVLNSVNASATLIEEGLADLRPANLGRAVELLKDQSTDLGRFHRDNEKGRRFLNYLDQLAQFVSQRQGQLLKETRDLTQNIEHIKTIVQMQQTYASLSGVVETVSVVELVESALKIHASAYARLAITVRRDYDEISAITADKHKVLHILVNLLDNAKHACADPRVAEKRVVLRIKKIPAGISIAVTDNGVGITPENLPRIFEHGFTTRKDGHGFGLHSAILAATEMGGSLTAGSDGPGRGATFVLTLPLQPG